MNSATTATKTWDEMVAEMPLDESKLTSALAAFEVVCKGGIGAEADAAWGIYYEACDSLNEREKIEFNERCKTLP